ncbi:zinc-ribbon domain-containing protein [Rickettsiales bacterium]|nr:zinc-ribbon domain-containing protein [Rickettsiales bacterium]
MIITCPECKSRFRLNIYEANAVKNQGRILHCGKCGHEWEHKPIVPAKIKTPMEKKYQEQKERKKLEKNEKIINLTEFVTKKTTEEINFIDKTPLKLKIIALFLLFVTISLAFINHRSLITYIVPKSESIYMFLGIYDNRDIQIERITISKDSIFNKDHLVLSGYIINKSNEIKYSPDLRITFLDKNHKVIKTIYSDLPNKELIPVDKSKISLKINQYPLDAHYMAFDIGNYLELLLR